MDNEEYKKKYEKERKEYIEMAEKELMAQSLSDPWNMVLLAERSFQLGFDLRARSSYASCWEESVTEQRQKPSQLETGGRE